MALLPLHEDVKINSVHNCYFCAKLIDTQIKNIFFKNDYLTLYVSLCLAYFSELCAQNQL